MRLKLYLPFVFSILLTSSNSVSREILTVLSNKTIVSPRSVFELGFFRPYSSEPGFSDHWYLGIWYKQDPNRKSLWVANKGKPLGLRGSLKFFDNNLALFGQSDSPIWTTNLTGGGVRSNIVEELLDNGNFILKESNYPDILWQSFDFPTDTLLWQMKLGRDPETGINKVLRSWNYPEDPSDGSYYFELKNQAGMFELFIWDKDDSEWSYRSDPWDGQRFGDIPPDILRLDNKSLSRMENAEDSFLMIGKNNARLTLSWNGELGLLTWRPETKTWDLSWSSHSDDCNSYGRCGPYGFCSINTTVLCNCIRGFNIHSKENWARGDWTGGCERRTPLSCGVDKFQRLPNMKLPDTKDVKVDMEVSLKECEERCRLNCDCTAYAHVGILEGRRGCVIWNRELKDLRNYTFGGQDLYLKVAAKDHG